MITTIYSALASIAPSAGWVLASAGALTAYYEYRKSQEDAKNYRQQLIALLHHAEGVASSLQQIHLNASLGNKYSSVSDIDAAVDSAAKNAEALFFGLIEYKVGGTAIKDEIDKKYSQWADINLEMKMLPAKQLIANNPVAGDIPPHTAIATAVTAS